MIGLPFGALHVNDTNLREVIGGFIINDTHSDPTVVYGEGFTVKAHDTVEGVYIVTIDDTLLTSIVGVFGGMAKGLTLETLDAADTNGYLSCNYTSLPNHYAILRTLARSDSLLDVLGGELKAELSGESSGYPYHYSEAVVSFRIVYRIN